MLLRKHMPTLLGVKIGHGGQFESEFFRPLKDVTSLGSPTPASLCVCVAVRSI